MKKTLKHLNFLSSERAVSKKAGNGAVHGAESGRVGGAS